MKKTRILIIVGILLLNTGCSLLPGTGGSDLEGTSWKLVSYGGLTPLPGKDMTAEFSGKEISGSASCNHYFGTYQVKGSQIKLEGLAWTEMACLDPEGIMEQEQRVMALLGDAASFSRQGSQLVITTSAGEQLIFQEY